MNRKEPRGQLTRKTKPRRPKVNKRAKAPGFPASLTPGKCPESDIQRSPPLGTILLVEDDPDDAFMVGRALQQVGIANPLVVMRDGEQAVQYLQGEGAYGDRTQFPIPQLILLDLHLPGIDGFQVLTWLRQESKMRHLPVVVLTSSTYSPDVKRAYQLGANSFLTKPTDFMELVAELKARCDFWLMGTATPVLSAKAEAVCHL